MNPQPGDFGLTEISGDVGRGIGFAQFLAQVNWKPWQWAAIWRRSRREHAFLLLDADGTIVEAEPGKAGARLGSASEYSNITWSSGAIPLTDGQRALVVAAGRSLVGVRYQYLDYLAIAAHRMHIWLPGLKHRIGRSVRAICSVLVDEAYLRGGVHLFSDCRWPSYVTPMDLADLLENAHVPGD